MSEILTASPAKRVARTTCTNCHEALVREGRSGDYHHASTVLNRCPDYAQPVQPAQPAASTMDKPQQITIQDPRPYVDKFIAVYDWQAGGTTQLTVRDNEADVDLGVDLDLAGVERLIARLQETVAYRRATTA